MGLDVIDMDDELQTRPLEPGPESRSGVQVCQPGACFHADLGRCLTPALDTLPPEMERFRFSISMHGHVRCDDYTISIWENQQV